MKVKVIDILNKIANGEQPPKKIIFRNDIYEYDEEDGDYYDNNNFNALFDYHEITDILNEEVQVLETTITYKPDKIEKLEITQEKNCNNNWKWKLNGYNISTPQKIMGDKINEIIEAINER